jgi:bacterioferritin-associated ferredoxin
MAFTCGCKGVRDQEVLDAAAAGCTTVESVGMATGAGTDCATCHTTIEALLALAAEADSESSVSS